MKKEDLRQIDYNFGSIPKKGFFHQWLVKKDEEGSDYAVALIELEDGTTIERHHTSIKFID